MWSSLVAVVLVVMSSDMVMSYSYGPPADTMPHICADMKPVHGHEPSSDPAPYEIITSQQCYKHGQKIKVSIRSKEDGKHPVYGLFVQARPVDMSEEAYGSFSTDNDHLQIFNCFNKPQSAIGHKEDRSHQHEATRDKGHEGEHHEGHDHGGHMDSHEEMDDHDGHSHEGHDHEGHDHDSHDHEGHDSHEGHDHEGHDHEGHDHEGHDHKGHDSHEGHDSHDSHEGHDSHEEGGSHQHFVSYDRQFEWTAGSDFDKDLIFMATVVEHKQTFWMHVHSDVLTYNPNCEEVPYVIQNEALSAKAAAPLWTASICLVSMLFVISSFLLSHL